MIYKKLHLLRRLLQQISFRFNKLWNTNESQSTLPLGRTTRPRLARHRMRGGGRGDYRAPWPLLGRGARSKEETEDIKASKTNPPKAEATDYTYLSMLPADVVFHFGVIDDSRAGSPAAPSWASDTVLLPDGPAHKSTLVSRRYNSKNQSKKRARQSIEMHT